MEEQDEPLEDVTFDAAATRPPLTLGLPHSLTVMLMSAGSLFLIVYDTGSPWRDLAADVIALGAIVMMWSAAKVMLRADYHGWDIWVAWMRSDGRMLDTREWGGAHLSSFPLRSIYRTGAHDGHV